MTDSRGGEGVASSPAWRLFEFWEALSVPEKMIVWLGARPR